MSRWQRRFVLALLAGVAFFMVGAFAPAFHLCRKDLIQGGPIRGSGPCHLFQALEVSGLILILLAPTFLIVLSLVGKRRRIQ